MKLLIAYIDNASGIEEHDFNKERCSGRTFEPCHPDHLFQNRHIGGSFLRDYYTTIKGKKLWIL